MRDPKDHSMDRGKKPSLMSEALGSCQHCSWNLAEIRGNCGGGRGGGLVGSSAWNQISVGEFLWASTQLIDYTPNQPLLEAMLCYVSAFDAKAFPSGQPPPSDINFLHTLSLGGGRGWRTSSCGGKKKQLLISELARVWPWNIYAHPGERWWASHRFYFSFIF